MEGVEGGLVRGLRPTALDKFARGMSFRGCGEGSFPCWVPAKHPTGAKARVDFVALAARLKACSFKALREQHFWHAAPTRGCPGTPAVPFQSPKKTHVAPADLGLFRELAGHQRDSPRPGQGCDQVGVVVFAGGEGGDRGKRGKHAGGPLDPTARVHPQEQRPGEVH